MMLSVLCSRVENDPYATRTAQYQLCSQGHTQMQPVVADFASISDLIHVHGTSKGEK